MDKLRVARCDRESHWSERQTNWPIEHQVSHKSVALSPVNKACSTLPASEHLLSLIQGPSFSPGPCLPGNGRPVHISYLETAADCLRDPVMSTNHWQLHLGTLCQCGSGEWVHRQSAIVANPLIRVALASRPSECLFVCTILCFPLLWPAWVHHLFEPIDDNAIVCQCSHQ